MFPQVKLVNAFPNLSFDSPIDFESPDDGTNRIFIVEQLGLIKVLPNNSSATSDKTFLDLRQKVTSGGELGLLGLAFDPDYKSNGYFYVYYTAPDTLRSVLARFKVSTTNTDSADPGSELILLEQDEPFQNHNGGKLVFGPDGYLYVGLGDGGSGGDPYGNGQNLKTLLGKILRINVDSTQGNLNYSIPSSNPFYGNTNGYKEEIFAYGLRNPWRFSFDSITGKLWCADVGQNNWEEIDTITSGGNYGWNIMEGDHCYNPYSNCDTTGLKMPIWEYSHQNGNCAIIGGFVYRGSTIPELYGKYIYGDYCSDNIWALQLDGDSVNNQLLFKAPANISAFGEDNNNNLYVCTLGDSIYKFVSAPTGIEKESFSPTKYKLFQNYPNPFNPSTKIRFFVPEKSQVSIIIVNSLGQIVKSFDNTSFPRGYNDFVWNAEGLSSGVYFIRMKATSLVSNNSYSSSIKAIYLK